MSTWKWIGLLGVLIAIWGIMAADCAPTSAPIDGGQTDNGGSGLDGGGGDGGTDGGGTDGGSDQTAAALVKTSIVLSANPGKIEAGDDLIVYGDNDTIRYIVPSVSDTTAAAGTEVPQGTLFDTRSFEVAGRKVALVRSSYLVAIFDTQTGTLSDVPGTQITLDRFVLPVEANAPGHMMADGSLVATINDTGAVADGNAIKVIDVSAAAPTVIGFPAPAGFEGSFDQVAVDAGTRRVAAHGDNPGEIIYVFDVDNPTAAPLAFDVYTDGFQDNVQMQFNGNNIIYARGNDDSRALLNVTSGAVTVFTNNPSNPNLPVAIQGGSFGYFMFASEEDITEGQQYRSVIGRVADAPTSTAANPLASLGSSSACVPGGIAGYGRTLCITPDGTRWFLAGVGPIDRARDHLQMSTGGAFTAFSDPDGDTLTGTVMATDVSCTSNTVAFRALKQAPSSGCLTNDQEVIGFIVIGRL